MYLYTLHVYIYIMCPYMNDKLYYACLLACLCLCISYTCRTLLRAFINGHTAGSDDAIAEDDLTVIEDSDSSLPEVIKPSKTLATTEVTRHLFSGGSYDTVLMILQDLSALEMEEAFDHVDIVQKVSDTATVRIDGVNA